LKPDVIAAYGMGPGGLSSFQNAGIRVLKASAHTVKDVIASFKENRLEELSDGCEHAHHHVH
jgi:predicted Fe-Mo cluster-binding NifX family protein